MAMLQYASGIFESAVNEAQRCFSAPLDHTRHSIELPPESANKLNNPNTFEKKPSNPNPFASMKEQSTPNSRGWRELGGFDSAPRAAADIRPIALGDSSRSDASGRRPVPPGHESRPGPSTPASWHDVSLTSATAANGCSILKEASPSRPTSSLSLVVVEKDGTRVSSSLNLPSGPADDCSQHTNSLAMEDTLTKRTSPKVLAQETEKSLEKLANLVDRAQQNLDPAVFRVAEQHHEALRQQEAEARSSWQIGSVLEVFSASLERWYPALVMELVTQDGAAPGTSDMLRVQFWLDVDDAKQKRLSRSDAHLALLGTNCKGWLPPGFEPRASSSRPGVSVFLDATNGLKYETADLAWAAHFQRWLEYRAPAGTETIRSLPAVVPSVAAPTSQTAPLQTAALPSAMEFSMQTALQVAQPTSQLATSQIAARPTPSKMDVANVQGLVTEYEMSREMVTPVSPASFAVSRLTASLAKAHSATQLEPAPIGLVTEYESDWNAIHQDPTSPVCKAEAIVRESKLEGPAAASLLVQSSDEAAITKELGQSDSNLQEAPAVNCQLEEAATSGTPAEGTGEDVAHENSAKNEDAAHKNLEMPLPEADGVAVHESQDSAIAGPMPLSLREAAAAAESALEACKISMEVTPGPQSLGDMATPGPPHKNLTMTVPNLPASFSLVHIPQHSAPAVVAACGTAPTTNMDVPLAASFSKMDLSASGDALPAEIPDKDQRGRTASTASGDALPDKAKFPYPFCSNMNGTTSEYAPSAVTADKASGYASPPAPFCHDMEAAGGWDVPSVLVPDTSPTLQVAMQARLSQTVTGAPMHSQEPALAECSLPEGLLTVP